MAEVNIVKTKRQPHFSPWKPRETDDAFIRAAPNRRVAYYRRTPRFRELCCAKSAAQHQRKLEAAGMVPTGETPVRYGRGRPRKYELTEDGRVITLPPRYQKVPPMGNAN
jgi:hypothetical protein